MGSGSWATYIALGIVLLIAYVFIKALANMFGGGRGKVQHCMTCGVEAASQQHTRGSILIEIVLWLCFLVPGLIYSLWRISSRKAVCSSCGSETLIPLTSPAAASHRKLLQGGAAPSAGA